MDGIMAGNAVQTKSFVFAVRIVKVCGHLRVEKKEYVLSRQLLKSGTAIGALVRESGQAESRADFTHKLAIALKEAHEAEYWLNLLYETKYLKKKFFSSLHADIVELIKLLTSIIKSTRNETKK